MRDKRGNRDKIAKRKAVMLELEEMNRKARKNEMA